MSSQQVRRLEKKAFVSTLHKLNQTGRDCTSNEEEKHFSFPLMSLFLYIKR